MRQLPTWGLWFMAAHSVFIVGVVLAVNWSRHGLRKAAPLAGAMTLVCGGIVGLVARFGFPDPSVGALQILGQALMAIIAGVVVLRMMRIRDSWRVFRLPSVWAPLVAAGGGLVLFTVALITSRQPFTPLMGVGLFLVVAAPALSAVRIIKLKQQYTRLDDRWGEVVSGEIPLSAVETSAQAAAELEEYREVLALLLPQGEEATQLGSRIDGVKVALAGLRSESL